MTKKRAVEISMSFLSFEEAEGEENVVEIEDGSGKRRVRLDDPEEREENEPDA